MIGAVVLKIKMLGFEFTSFKRYKFIVSNH